MHPDDLLKSDLLSEIIVIAAAVAATVAFLTFALAALRVPSW
jgi:hypothetical protein